MGRAEEPDPKRRQMANSKQWMALLERSNIVRDGRSQVQLPFAVIRTRDASFETFALSKDIVIDQDGILIPEGNLVLWEELVYVMLRIDIGSQFWFQRAIEDGLKEDHHRGATSKWIGILESRGDLKEGRIVSQHGMYTITAGDAFDLVDHAYPWVPKSYDRDFLYLQSTAGVMLAIAWDQVTDVGFR